MGTRSLDITLISAYDLKNVNVLSNMHVYAVATFSGESQTTSVHRDCGVKPNWNHRMRFTVDEASLSQNNLHITYSVKASRGCFGDSDLGKVHVSIQEMLAQSNNGSEEKSMTYNITTPGGRSKGYLNVSFKFSPAPPAPAMAAAPIYDTPQPGMSYPPPGTVGGYPPPPQLMAAPPAPTTASSPIYDTPPPGMSYPPPGTVGAGSYPPPDHHAGSNSPYPPPSQRGYPPPDNHHDGVNSAHPPPDKGVYPLPDQHGGYPPPDQHGGYPLPQSSSPIPPPNSGYPPPAGFPQLPPPPLGYGGTPQPQTPPPALASGYNYPPPGPGPSGMSAYGNYHGRPVAPPKQTGGGGGSGLGMAAGVGLGMGAGALGGLAVASMMDWDLDSD
ncbi:hypothetical protein Pint_19833 [Pistacia integerrima]|uniref:Uncharacterized protein n=1 Tax=Pistacia integerrima TaxID=434235 RepID=A0ACC0XDJ7_9ROSI|nr:hypothetical protein Pint_19833 [Pistacia integerrima]